MDQFIYEKPRLALTVREDKEMPHFVYGAGARLLEAHFAAVTLTPSVRTGTFWARF